MAGPRWFYALALPLLLLASTALAGPGVPPPDPGPESARDLFDADVAMANLEAPVRGGDSGRVFLALTPGVKFGPSPGHFATFIAWRHPVTTWTEDRLGHSLDHHSSVSRA